jgi:peptidoglycan/xylan/chitin deacetylase (PgdA/CDA1 family)
VAALVKGLLTLGLWAIGLRALPLWGEAWFSELDLAAFDRLLFQAEADSPVFGPYRTLFAAELADGRLEQLTFFPERASLVAGVLQVENRFGLFRTDSSLGHPAPVAGLPSFVAGGQVESGKLDQVASSPDGRWLVRLSPTSAAYGELLLHDLSQAGRLSVASTGVELSLKAVPVLWSPDSDFFLYAKQGSLYYFSVSQLREKRVLEEPYRLLGRGTVRNVRWGPASLAGGSAMYYVTGTLVYRLNPRELFTRSLYGGFLPIGQLAGKLPFELDPNFDEFWVAPDATQLLVDKGGRNLFLVPLSPEDYSGPSLSLPYLYLPGSGAVRKVLWLASGKILVLAESRQRGAGSTGVYLLSAADLRTLPSFRRIPEEGVLDLALSPDESSVAVMRADGVTVHESGSWQKRQSLSHPHPLHLVWTPTGELIVAGAWLTELWNPASGVKRLLCLSQPGDSSFSEDERAILTEVQGAYYRRPAVSGSSAGAAGAWGATGSAALRPPRLESAAYRVYLEDCPDRFLRNRVMVRDLRQYGTRELLARPEVAYEPFPAAEEPPDPLLFAHGSRIRRREVALVFDVVDAVEGLASILSSLEEYGIRATFFVNGDALRRYPDAIREIAEAGHEVGSLFFTNFNMTDDRFKVDGEFIKRGLARAEDEYHAVSGRELALLWHAPFYFANSQIIAAGRELNYAYVSRDVDTLDWVTEDPGKMAPDIYFTASELVERIVARKKPGSILPILAGKPGGHREDYLFQKLDLLVDALLSRGYSVVTVSSLMEHAR